MLCCWKTEPMLEPELCCRTAPWECGCHLPPAWAPPQHPLHAQWQECSLIVQDTRLSVMCSFGHPLSSEPDSKNPDTTVARGRKVCSWIPSLGAKGHGVSEHHEVCNFGLPWDMYQTLFTSFLCDVENTQSTDSWHFKTHGLKYFKLKIYFSFMFPILFSIKQIEKALLNQFRHHKRYKA